MSLLPVEIWGRIVSLTVTNLEQLCRLSCISKEIREFCWKSSFFKVIVLASLVETSEFTLSTFNSLLKLHDAIEILQHLIRRKVITPQSGDFIAAAFRINRTDVIIELTNSGWPFVLSPSLVAKSGNLELLMWMHHRNADSVAHHVVLDSACESGHINIIKWMMDDIGVKSEASLHHAARGGHEHVIDYLHEHSGIDINHHNFMEITPLFLAARKGHKTIVKKLLDFGADINTVCRHGMTALHGACDMGHLEIVKVLCESGKCDLNIQDVDGRTALHWAVWSSAKDVVHYLADRNADFRLVDRNGFEPLHTAIHCNQPDLLKDIIDILLRDQHEKANPGLTLSLIHSEMKADMSAVDMCAYKGYTECLDILLSYGAVLTKKCLKGQQPFHLAAIGGNLETAEFILKRLDTPPEKISDLPLIPGMFEKTLQNRNYFVSQALVESGFAPNLTIHEVVVAGDLYLLQYLHKQGFYIDTQVLGKTPAEIAAIEGFDYILDWMLSLGRSIGRKNTLAHMAAMHNRPSVITVLKQRHCPLDEKDEFGNSPLFIAAEMGNAEIILRLIELGVSPFFNNDSGLSAIDAAARVGHEGVVQLLSFLCARDIAIRSSKYEDYNTIFKISKQLHRISNQNIESFVFRHLEEIVAIGNPTFLSNYFKFKYGASSHVQSDYLHKLLLLAAEFHQGCCDVIFKESGLIKLDEDKNLSPREYALKYHDQELLNALGSNTELR